MGRHHPTVTSANPDYFEERALEMEEAQLERYRADPPKDDDLIRHLREEKVAHLIQQFRAISATYKEN